MDDELGEKRIGFTSQKNSFPRRPQNQDIHDTSSELLIVDSLSLLLFSNDEDEVDVVVLEEEEERDDLDVEDGSDLDDLSFLLFWKCSCCCFSFDWLLDWARVGDCCEVCFN